MSLALTVSARLKHNMQYRNIGAFAAFVVICWKTCCTSKIDVAVKLAEEKSVNCITQIQRFKASICDESVLELLAYFVNRKEFPEKNEVEKINIFLFCSLQNFFWNTGTGWAKDNDLNY